MAEPKPKPAPEPALGRLLDLARRGGSGEMSERMRARGRERLLGELERAALPLAPRPWWLIPAAAAPLLLILGVLFLRPAAQLSFTIDGAPPAQSYVLAGPSGASARFSEGTEIRFAPSARGRISDVTAHGARVSLEQGSAHFRVMHLPGATWTAEAGPFVVAVTGTEFDLRWEHERLDVVMQDGAVIVRGPLASGGIALRGGQQLVADVTRGELTIAEPKNAAREQAPPSVDAEALAAGRAAPNADVPRAAEPPAPAATASGGSPLGSSAPASGAPRSLDAPALGAPTASPLVAALAPGHPAAPSFRERLSRGDFAGVIADAEARGVDAVLSSGPLDDLAALADAARYAGRADLARRALLAERSRFAGAPEARSAAFLLGRMAETGSPAAAIAWYDQYLTESPNGSLASEALGRKMVAVKASLGREAARPVAEAYVKRYPQGALAAVAAEILVTP